MAKNKKEIVSAEIAEQKYSRSALIASGEFVRSKDLLKVLLKDGELYTISEAKAIVNNYLNKEV